VRGDGIAKASADQRGGYSEHFTHARAASRAFVTNDNNVARLDGAVLNGGKSCFFIVEHACGAAKILDVVTGNFYDATFRGEISLEDDEPAGRLERRVEFADNFLRWRFLGACGFLGEGASSDGETIAAEQSSFNQALCESAVPPAA